MFTSLQSYPLTIFPLKNPLVPLTSGSLMKHISGSRGTMTLHDLSKNTSVPASEEHISNMPNPGSVCQSDNLVFGYRQKCSILVETIATIGYFKEIRVLTNSVNVDREPKFLVQNLRKPARFHSLTSCTVPDIRNHELSLLPGSAVSGNVWQESLDP